VGWPLGGAERSVELLRAALVQRGHLVCVVATDIYAAERSDVFADVLIPHISGGPLRRLRQHFFYHTAYQELRRLFKSFRPDIVHFHTVTELSPAALFAAWGIPFVMTVHGPEDFTLALYPWGLPASDYRNGTYRPSDLRVIGRLRCLYLRVIQRPAYQFALRRCAAVVAPSGFFARILERDVDPGRIVRIDNGIDLPDAARPPGGGRFLFVGRLEAYKGVDVLLRAFARAREQRPGMMLTIAGDGAERDALEALASEVDLSGAVTFLGRIGPNDVVRALIDCDGLVIPSIVPENRTTVALEAMGVGRAMLGSRVGGIPELITDGVNGFLTDPYDEGALADGMVRLASQPDLCRHMGEASRRRATAYTGAAFVSNILALYDRTVRAAAGRSTS
jgi:glycosyltransferase involved in cell wall biosynthesis